MFPEWRRPVRHTAGQGQSPACQLSTLLASVPRATCGSHRYPTNTSRYDHFAALGADPWPLLPVFQCDTSPPRHGRHRCKLPSAPGKPSMLMVHTGVEGPSWLKLRVLQSCTAGCRLRYCAFFMWTTAAVVTLGLCMTSTRHDGTDGPPLPGPRS